MQTLKRILTEVKKLFDRPAGPYYRVVEIKEDETGVYHATIQLINTRTIMTMKPEAILADDKLTDAFSPRDIRTLTYLGYLGINSPKYKILAKRLLENDKKLVFAIKQRGEEELLLKTAEEISTDEELLKNLDQKDAHTIGYTSGSQTVSDEKAQMAKLIAQQQAKKVNKK